MALVHSSVIPTGAATDSRTRDQLSFVFNSRPQAMTIYLRFVEQGSVQKSGTVIFQLGATGATNPRILIDCTGSFYRAFHINAAGSSVSATLAATPTVGQSVEIRFVLSSTGTVLLGQSIAGGAETVTATSSALALPASAWAAPILWLNSAGTLAVGYTAFRNVEIMQGVQTMQAMRVRAGTD